jgi:hypothetical protein
MIKKFALIDILGLTVILALSAFSAVAYQPVISNALSIAPKGFQTPLLSDFVASIGVTGFQTPPYSNFVASSGVTGFQTPPYSNFVASSGVTGFLANPLSLQDGWLARQSAFEKQKYVASLSLQDDWLARLAAFEKQKVGIP